MSTANLFEFYNDNHSYISTILSPTTTSRFLFGNFMPHVSRFAKFWNLSNKQVSKAKKQKKIFVLDSMYEGFSNLYYKPNLDEIYQNCELLSINPKQIILVTMNLVAHQNLKQYLQSHNAPKIQILSQSFGEYELYIRSQQFKTTDVNIDLINTKKQFKKLCKNKILLNLNHRFKQPRSLLAFYLATSKIKDYCLVSHNQKYITEFDRDLIKRIDRSCKQEKRWSKNTPMIIDKKITTNFKLHQSTVFEVVGETLTGSWCGTSREYSEKTFRPIVNFQPFVIYGQKGCNHYLKNLGYKTYEDWFDLSFDFIDDDVERLLGLYKSVEEATIKLSKMTKCEQYDWRFKNEAVLKHNYENFFCNVQNIIRNTKSFFDRHM